LQKSIITTAAMGNFMPIFTKINNTAKIAAFFDFNTSTTHYTFAKN
jgi:hypothetical protein